MNNDNSLGFGTILLIFLINYTCAMPVLLFASNNRVPVFRRPFKPSGSLNFYSISPTKENIITNWRNTLPANLRDKVNCRLDMDISNPIGIIAHYIKSFFQTSYSNVSYHSIPLTPISIYDNFDTLFVPYSHSSRSPSESYYITLDYISRYNQMLSEYNKYHIENLPLDEIIDLSSKFGHSNLLMPTHSTFYLPKLLSQDIKFAIYSGQVWRRDSIDSYHYPIFHQLDGYKLFNPETLDTDIISDLKSTMELLIMDLFCKTNIKPSIEWKEDSFPFTNPSFEMYININGISMEVLGCGLIKPQIIRNALQIPKTNPTPIGWAFGIGLERLSMSIFGIPDIRLFWETDSRFINQFKDSISTHKLPKFVEFSKHPPIARDISFFFPQGESDLQFKSKFFEIVKSIGGDLVESIDLIDRYEMPLDGNVKQSLCYRITYRAFRNLTNPEVNKIHAEICNKLSLSLGITIR